METDTGHRWRWGILAVLSICLLVVVLDNTILNVALKTIQQDLGATQSELEWAVNSYALVFAALLFSAGVLADSYGRRLLVIGMLAFGAASALSAFATSPEQLIVFRGLMGIGAAAVPPATLAILTDVFPPRERGKAIGLWSGVAGLAIALGPVSGGLLLEHFWWGSVFLVNVPFVVVAAVLIMVLVPESKADRRRHLDPVGVLLSISGIGLLVYGIIRGGETNHWLGAEVLGTGLGGIALLVLLVRFEQRAKEPALDVTLFRDHTFSAGVGVLALAFFGLTGGTFVLAFYVQVVLGFSPLEAGLLMLPVAAGTMITATRSASLAARFGPRAVVTTGMLLSAAVFASYALMDRNTPVWQLELALGLFGLGFGCVMAPATTAVMAVVPQAKAAAGSAVNNTLRQVGSVLGVAVIGSVLAGLYRSSLGTAAQVLPEDLREGARDSLGATLSALQSAGQRADGLQQAARAGDPAALEQLRALGPLREQGPVLVEHAIDAYLTGLHVAVLAASVAMLIGGLVALRWLPKRISQRPEPAPELAASVH